jgi:uncharacterized RDD family membrane protein YckC
VPPPPAPVGFQQPATPGMFGQYQLGGYGNRVGAWFIDAIVSFLPMYIGIVITAATDSAAGAVLIILGIFVPFFYYPLTMMRPAERNGQTLGKQALNIRVIRDNGQPFDFGSALLREFVIKYLLFGVVGGFFFAIPWLIDYLWPLWDEQNRALHDMLAQTHVVKA